MPALAQTTEEPSPESSPESTAISTSATEVPPTATPAPNSGTPSPPPTSAIDAAIAGAISSSPYVLVFGLGLLFAAFVIRDRRKLEAAGTSVGLSPDMAKGMVDTLVGGLLQGLTLLTKGIPGQIDNKLLEDLVLKAGLIRVDNPDGSVHYIEATPRPAYATATVSSAAAARSPYAHMERVVMPDGSFAYKASAATGIPRTYNEDGSWTRTPSTEEAADALYAAARKQVGAQDIVSSVSYPTGSPEGERLAGVMETAVRQDGPPPNQS